MNVCYHFTEFAVFWNSKTFAVLGDTDNIPELSKLECDYLFVPIGGTYTMNAQEAATLTNKIKPKVVLPVHYNSIVGNKKDEATFVKLIDKTISIKIVL